MKEDSVRYVLWEWNVARHDFDDRLRAAVVGGFDVLTLSYRDYRRFAAQGRSPEDLAETAKAADVKLDFLDGLSDWAPVRLPDGADEFLSNALDFSADEGLELCERAGMRNIVAIAGFECDRLPMSELVDSFGRFCDRAAAAGIHVDLEPMPMLGLPTLSHAWQVVREADRPNSAILFDSWHFMRGDPDFALLRSIPRGRIVNAQIVDGAAALATRTLWEDATHHRELPGYGELPLAEIMSILKDTQTLRSIGPEAISDRLAEMTAERCGEEAGQSMEACAVRAGYPARRNRRR